MSTKGNQDNKTSILNEIKERKQSVKTLTQEIQDLTKIIELGENEHDVSVEDYI